MSLPDIQDIPTFMKVLLGEFSLLHGYQKAELTESEKFIILEQFEPYWEKCKDQLGVDKNKAVQIFCSGYLCGMLFGAGGVRSMAHLDKVNN
jgi:hypothetical protein